MWTEYDSPLDPLYVNYKFLNSVSKIGQRWMGVTLICLFPHLRSRPFILYPPHKVSTNTMPGIISRLADGSLWVISILKCSIASIWVPQTPRIILTVVRFSKTIHCAIKSKVIWKFTMRQSRRYHLSTKLPLYLQFHQEGQRYRKIMPSFVLKSRFIPVTTYELS